MKREPLDLSTEQERAIAREAWRRAWITARPGEAVCLPSHSDMKRIFAEVKGLTRSEFREFVQGANLDDDALFTEFVQKTVEVLGISERDLASGLRISVPTAARWINGVTRPHVGVRASVRRFVLKRLEP